MSRQYLIHKITYELLQNVYTAILVSKIIFVIKLFNFKTKNTFRSNMQSQQPSGKEAMMSFIDKLCDHLPNEKIKYFIDNGFDEWETVILMKGQQLTQMNFTSQECIIIAVSINATAKQFGYQQVFAQDTMQTIISTSKEKQTQRAMQLQQQKQQKPIQKIQPVMIIEDFVPKQYPVKQLNEALIWKGTTMKANKGQKISSVTMISLEEKGITHVTELEKALNLQIVHLSHNHIAKIEGFQKLIKIKTLKLDYNQISKIQNLHTLQLLEKLNLNDNHISKVQNLSNNKHIHQFWISNQKIKGNLSFQEQSMMSMSYSLEKLQCNNSRVNNIQPFKYLTVIKQIQLKGNLLADIGQLSEALGSMQLLKSLNFQNNPITKVQKYRDYIVILAKNLQELDQKKILPTERQYLVKLYSLKHTNQLKDGIKSKGTSKKDLDLQGKKMKESHGGANMFYQGPDLRGNVPYQNTKNQNIKK